MRVILPQLESTEPDALLAGLRGIIPLPTEDNPDGDLNTSLAASITYSFAHLADKTHQLLPALCLVSGVASTGVLATFSDADGVPSRFVGADVKDWTEALNDAARVGLLTALGSGMYQVHPALPSYLAALWRAESPDGHDSTRDDATRALLEACAQYGVWLAQLIDSGNAGLAYEIIELQQRTLGALLRYALEHKLWEQAHDIGKPVTRYWETRGLDDEAEAWTIRVRSATEEPDGTPPPLDSPAGPLWLIFTGAQATRQWKGMRLDEAEHTYRQVLDMLQVPVSAEQRSNVAVAQHHLGMIAQLRGRLEEAEDWYHKALRSARDFAREEGPLRGSVADVLRRGVG
jgi:tetratricopeptide (TPR) repeat protein